MCHKGLWDKTIMYTHQQWYVSYQCKSYVSIFHCWNCLVIVIIIKLTTKTLKKEKRKFKLGPVSLLKKKKVGACDQHYC